MFFHRILRPCPLYLLTHHDVLISDVALKNSVIYLCQTVICPVQAYFLMNYQLVTLFFVFFGRTQGHCHFLFVAKFKGRLFVGQAGAVPYSLSYKLHKIKIRPDIVYVVNLHSNISAYWSFKNISTSSEWGSSRFQVCFRFNIDDACRIPPYRSPHLIIIYHSNYSTYCLPFNYIELVLLMSA
jgi:preprotein translocase subunit Sec61beta